MGNGHAPPPSSFLQSSRAPPGAAEPLSPLPGLKDKTKYNHAILRYPRLMPWAIILRPLRGSSTARPQPGVVVPACRAVQPLTRRCAAPSPARGEGKAPLTRRCAAPSPAKGEETTLNTCRDVVPAYMLAPTFERHPTLPRRARAAPYERQRAPPQANHGRRYSRVSHLGSPVPPVNTNLAGSHVKRAWL
jgi:hypothetical protein